MRAVAFILAAVLVMIGNGSAQTIEAGKFISVKLEHSVSTKSADVDDAISARVDPAIRQNGDVVIPSGSTLRGRVEFVQRKSISDNGWLRLLFTRFDLPDGRKVDTQAFASFQIEEHHTIIRTILTVTGLSAAGALIAGNNRRVAGGLGGAILGLVLTDRDRHTGRDLSLHSGMTLHLRLVADLSAPGDR